MMKLMQIYYRLDEDIVRYKHYTVDALKLWNKYFNNVINIDIKYYNRSGVVGEFEYMSIFDDKIVIYLNINEIANNSESEDDVEFGIKMTVIHELFHAMVAIDNNFEFIRGANVLNYDDEEEYVEDLSFNLVNYDKIDNDVLKLSKLYKKHKNNLKKFYNPYHDDYGYDPFEAHR